MPERYGLPRPVMGGEWMIRKFATASGVALPIIALMLIVLLAHPGLAQTAQPAQTPADSTQATPAQQQPATQQPAAQQPSSSQDQAEEELPMRQKKPRDYKNWNFNVAAGASTVSGTTFDFVRNGGFVAAAGVARNANKYLGLRLDLMFADLPLRDSTQELAQATGATNYAGTVMLDPIFNIPVTSKWSGYGVIGSTFIHRWGTLQDDTTVPGSQCTSFWTWWGACTNISLPLTGDFTSSHQNEFGYNVGGGVARKFPSGAEIYAEYRLIHTSNSPVTTDFRPITIGFRW
jgi:opacity protein-like surface antigen